MRIFTMIVLVSFVLLSQHVFAFSYKAQQFQSKEQRVALIELFSSEGCHSCPPAEHWLNDLKNKENLWEDFVPVAFHVDYWDYLGWKDIYAKSVYSQRQHFYASENREPGVYTPGVRANGREFRHWRRADLGKLSEFKGDAVGVLDFNINEDGTFTAAFNVSGQKKPAALGINGELHFVTVALLGMGISTDVKRGENAGKILNHEFIVLESQDFEINNGSWSGKLPTSELPASKYAIAAWVSTNKSQSPVQVVGGFLN